jgi:pimeloyl-ACP methyl ester carboxylesterase
MPRRLPIIVLFASGFAWAFLLAAQAQARARAGWLAMNPGQRLDSVFRAPGRDPRLLQYGQGQIEFVEIRSAEADSGTPAVYIHGLGGNLGDFGPSLLADAPGIRIALNLPGTGRSTAPQAGSTIRAFAETLREILVTRMAHPKVDLICHSLGGQVCLAMALEFPGNVGSLTLIDAAGTYDQSEFVRRMAKDFAGVNLGEVLVSTHPAIGLLTGGNQNILGRVLGGDAGAIAALSSFGQNYRDRIPAVAVPVLLIWGEKDALFTLENAFFLRNNIAGSRLKVVPDAGHVPQLTHPDLVDGWIAGFRQGIAGTGKEEHADP